MNWFNKSKEKTKSLEIKLSEEKEAYNILKARHDDIRNKMNNINTSPLGQYYQGPSGTYSGTSFERAIGNDIENLKSEIKLIKSNNNSNIFKFYKNILVFFGVDYGTGEKILELVQTNNEDNTIMASNMLFGFIKEQLKEEIKKEINEKR